MIKVCKIYYYFEEEDKKAFVDLLKANELSQKEFAKRFEMSQAYLSAVLNGKRSCPDFILDILRRRVSKQCS